MRHKLHQSSEECKKLQRALQKEVGDGASLDQVGSTRLSVTVLYDRNCHIPLLYFNFPSPLPCGAHRDYQVLEDGWKGRAQQIVMLKNKVISHAFVGRKNLIFEALSLFLRSASSSRVCRAWAGGPWLRGTRGAGPRLLGGHPPPRTAAVATHGTSTQRQSRI
jgi:hypothetical protein